MPHNDKARHTVRFFVTSWQRLVAFAAHDNTDDRVAKQGSLQAGTVCANMVGEAGARCAGTNRRITMKHDAYTAARAAIYRAAVRHLDAKGRNQFAAARQYADGAMMELDPDRRSYEMRQFDTKSRRPVVVEW